MRIILWRYKVKSKKSETILERIDKLPMPDVLIDSFNRYAKEVILDRAIPDARDGLKPVQRRIVFSMWRDGNTHNKPTVKCARSVGNVLGHFHPHGDSSVYDAMVRLSQDWKMNVPLLEFQGNNGSIDNDPAAAYRYTESRLSAMADFMVQDIEKNTVDMMLNFDDTVKEPIVLPSRFPNLLVNGSQGIAVGAATNIPTHNLGEVIDATVYRLEHKRATVSDMRQFILGPDFPTGGIIDDVDALNNLYETGQGSFYIHCTVDSTSEKGKIILTDIPYGEIKSTLVADLDKRRIESHLDSVVEVRDESTEDIRIVIELKKDANPEPVINFYRNKGALRSTFAANMLAIDKGHPKTMNLLEMIDAYIDHQKEVILRRSKFDFDKKSWRLSIVRGLIKAVSVLDEVIHIIRHSSGKEDSKNKLIERFQFTPEQAEAIVTLQLYRLSNTDVTILQEEEKTLIKELDDLKQTIENEDKLVRLIVADLKAIKKQYATPRKTKILEEKIKTENVDQRSLIAKEDVMVVLTRDGYIKKTALRSYEASIQSSKGSDPFPKLKVSDKTVFCQKTTTHANIVFFTNKGLYYSIPCHLISDAKWKEEGKHINNLVNLEPKEKIVSAFAVEDYKKGLYFALTSKLGKIKRTEIIDFECQKITTKGLRAMPLVDGDELVSAILTHGNSDIMVMTDQGQVSRYNENEVPIVSTKASGVKAINFGSNEKSYITATLSYKNDEHSLILILNDKNGARLLNSSVFPCFARLGQKTAACRIFKSSPMTIISMDKIYRKKDVPCIVPLDTENGLLPVDLNSLEVSQLGAGMKANLPETNSKILGLCENGEIIDENTPVEKAPEIISEPAKPKEKSPTQVSLFDMFDEEN